MHATPKPILGYSKAPWGLSVLSRVTGIFTSTHNFAGRAVETVPGSLRLSCRVRTYPDKEFRYLRTVIVTAAVHWGFNSMLAHLLLTFQHRAGVSSYTSSFDLAQTCVFGKQLPGPILCGSLSRHPLFRSYGVNLPSSLTTPSPVGLRIFFLPTCVGLRYGHLRYTRSFFSPLIQPDFGTNLPSISTRTNSWLRPSKVSLRFVFRWGRNLYRLCIGYAFRPHLSSRLTWSGRTFLKTWVSGHDDSHIIRATHSGILTSVNSTAAFATVSPLTQRSPTPCTKYTA